MNSEKLVIQAAEAMNEWGRDHRMGCQLAVKDNRVIAGVADGRRRQTLATLYISPSNIRDGFTSEAWKIIGTKLLNLYNKENACHSHQRH